MIKSLLQITKPGIVRGNVIVALCAFLFGASSPINWRDFVAMGLGLTFVVASGCVFNNIIDRDIDAKMTRTKNRVLVQKLLSLRTATIYAAILLFSGEILLLNVNILSALIALFGWIMYVPVYSSLKRVTVHGTVIGSISGATPPVVGYVAATNQLDTTAILLMLILASWQMPHFYAIAIYRLGDYSKAKIPVLPSVKGFYETRLQIIAYTALYIASVAVLVVVTPTSYSFAVIMLTVSGWWLVSMLQNVAEEPIQQEIWAKKIFKKSLVSLLLFSILLALDHSLP